MSNSDHTLGKRRYQLGLVGVQFIADIALFYHASQPGADLSIGCIAMTGYFILFPISVFFFYRLYESFPEEADTWDPEEAAFPVLIPVFNVYWVYRMLQDFREAVIRVADEYTSGDRADDWTRADSRLADAGNKIQKGFWGTIFWFGGLIVFVRTPIGNWLVHWLMVGKAIDAANALRQKFGPRGGSRAE